MKRYKFYNENNELLYEAKSQAELSKKCGIIQTYISKNTDKGFFKKPFTDEFYRIELIIEPKKTYKVISKSKRSIITDLPGEVWKEIDGYSGNFVSNLGRVKFVDLDNNERLTIPKKTRNATGLYYYDVSLYDQTSLKFLNEFRLGRIVAKTFIDNSLSLCRDNNKKLEIHYNDDNTLNNSADNLQIMSHKDIIHLAISKGKQVGNKKRRCYHKKDGVTKEFDSTIDLMESIVGNRKSSNSGYFFAAVKNGRKIRGYEVGYLD